MPPDPADALRHASIPLTQKLVCCQFYSEPSPFPRTKIARRLAGKSRDSVGGRESRIKSRVINSRQKDFLTAIDSYLAPICGFRSGSLLACVTFRSAGRFELVFSRACRGKTTKQKRSLSDLQRRMLESTRSCLSEKQVGAQIE